MKMYKKKSLFFSADSKPIMRMRVESGDLIRVHIMKSLLGHAKKFSQ